MEDFRVIFNSDQRLDILKVSEIHNPTGIVTIVLSVLLSLLLLFFPFKGAVLRAVLRIAGVVGPLYLVATTLVSYDLELRRDTAMATFKRSFAGMPYSNQTTPLANLKRVEIESNRGQRRLALLVNEGYTLHPFGSTYDSQANQYNVQDEVNAFLRQ